MTSFEIRERQYSRDEDGNSVSNGAYLFSTDKENGGEANLFCVRIYDPNRGTFRGPVFVLAQDDRSAVNQCSGDLASYRVNDSRIAEDVEKYSKVERVPFLIRGWGEEQF